MFFMFVSLNYLIRIKDCYRQTNYFSTPYDFLTHFFIDLSRKVHLTGTFHGEVPYVPIHYRNDLCYLPTKSIN